MKQITLTGFDNSKYRLRKPWKVYVSSLVDALDGKKYYFGIVPGSSSNCNMKVFTNRFQIDDDTDLSRRVKNIRKDIRKAKGVLSTIAMELERKSLEESLREKTTKDLTEKLGETVLEEYLEMKKIKSRLGSAAFSLYCKYDEMIAKVRKKH